MTWQTSEEAPHSRLDVWRLGVRLARQIYAVTRDFPDEETYGLVSQLRRAAVSVPSNIAEGSARRTTSDFLRFLYQARGSLMEIDTQMRLADDLGYLPDEGVSDTRETFVRVSRTLQALVDALEEKR